MKKSHKFCQALIVARMSAGMPQSEFCKVLNISPACLGHWERGETTPSAKRIPMLAKNLNMDVFDLIKMITNSD